MSMQNRYKMKGVLFDTSSDCKELRKELTEKGIANDTVMFGIEEEHSLRKAIVSLGVSALDVLLITNNKQHAEIAEKIGVSCVGSMEGLSELPKVNTLLESPGEVSVSYLEMLFCHDKKFPAIILETERCYLREMTSEDFQQLFSMYQKPEITKFMPESMTNQFEEQEKLNAYVTWTYSFFGYGYWGVYDKQTDQLIGRAGFEVGSEPLEVGYLINRDDWGKGYATEVLVALLQYAEQELDSIEVVAKIFKKNLRSCHVAEKCGMIREKKSTEETYYLYTTKKAKAQENVSA